MFQMEELNVDCVAELARYHGYSEEAMEDELYKVRDHCRGKIL